MPSPTAAEGIPWVVFAVDPGNPNETVLIHEIEECRSWIEPQDRDYLDALLAEWKMTLNKDGDVLLKSLSRLAIGPLRTEVSGESTKEELGDLARALREKTSKMPPPRIA